jgi:hypothetical protein
VLTAPLQCVGAHAQGKTKILAINPKEFGTIVVTENVTNPLLSPALKKQGFFYCRPKIG